MKTTKNIKMVLAALCFGCGWSVQGVNIFLDTPVANLTERWSTNSSGWYVKDLLANTANCWSSGALVVSHPAAMIDTPITEYIFGGTNASDTRFSGDYSRIDSVSFDVRTTGLSTNPVFYFKTKAGVVWNYRLNSVPLDTAMGTLNVMVPMAYSSDWKTGAFEPVFDNDKKNVVEIGVKLTTPKVTTVVQQVVVDNFKLVGPWNGPFTSNNVAVAWLLENNLAIDQDVSDTDHDGQSNDVEFLAGTDPSDSNDVFRVEIRNDVDGKPVVSWKEKNKYATYSLLEGTDLNDSASFVEKAGWVNMQGSGTQKDADVVSDDSVGPLFYKVQIKAQ